MAASRVREGQLKELNAVVAQNSIQTDLNRSELLVQKKQRANAQSAAVAEEMIESTIATRARQRSDRARLQTQNQALATEMIAYALCRHRARARRRHPCAPCRPRSQGERWAPHRPTC